MKKVLWSLFFSALAYIFVLNLGNAFYLTQVNRQFEKTIEELVSQIAEIQSQNAWDNLREKKRAKIVFFCYNFFKDLEND